MRDKKTINGNINDNDTNNGYLKIKTSNNNSNIKKNK
jgi:hypothetical protein